MVSRLIAFLSFTPRMGVKKAAETGRPQINTYLPNIRGGGRCALLPMSGHVDDPVLPGRLLLVVPLVLAGGVGVIDHRSANTA